MGRSLGVEAVVEEKVILSRQGSYDYLHQLRCDCLQAGMKILKVAGDTHEPCWIETLLFPLLTEVESEKERPSLFSLDSVSLLHTPSSSSPVHCPSLSELWSLVLLMWQEQQFALDAEGLCTGWLTSQVEDVALGKWRLSRRLEHCAPSFAALSWCRVMGRRCLSCENWSCL